jgi:hypothetical protein
MAGVQRFFCITGYLRRALKQNEMLWGAHVPGNMRGLSVMPAWAPAPDVVLSLIEKVFYNVICEAVGCRMPDQTGDLKNHRPEGEN